MQKFGKKNIVVNLIDESIEEAFSFVLNTGNNINMVEPLRDFNGFSWNVIAKDIEDLNCNLIYQNIIYLVGNKFVDKWVNNYEPLVDYFDLFQSQIEKKYGKRIKNNIIKYLLKLSIILKMNIDENFKKEIQNKRNNLEHEYFELENRELYIVKISKLKKKYEKNIKKIDKIMNDKNLLLEEYESRNEKLPIEKKIFSIRVLKDILKEERKNLLKEIENCNNMINPKFFIQNKKKIEEKLKYIENYENLDLKNELKKYLILLQKQIIKCINIDINNAVDKTALIELIYKFRYYNLLVIDKRQYIFEQKELKNILKAVFKTLIDKAIEKKIIIKIFEDDKINYEITSKLLLSKIISLQDINIRIEEEDDGIYLIIYDEQIEENKIKLDNITKKQINVKLNKNIKLFI